MEQGSPEEIGLSSKPMHWAQIAVENRFLSGTGTESHGTMNCDLSSEKWNTEQWNNGFLTETGTQISSKWNELGSVVWK